MFKTYSSFAGDVQRKSCSVLLTVYLYFVHEMTYQLKCSSCTFDVHL